MQNLLFLSAGIFQTYFSSSISRLSAEIQLSLLADGGKRGKGLIFNLKKEKKSQDAFVTSWGGKKMEVAALFEKRRMWILLNFVKSPFFYYIEFYEESVFLILSFVKSPFFLLLNFVKCLKTDSIFPLDTPLNIQLNLVIPTFSGPEKSVVISRMSR